MVTYTRRTHIVRISDAQPGQPPSSTYIDIEVLDAIAFRLNNGHEVILDMRAANSSPKIVDKTGGNHAKDPDVPTQLTHMKRIVNPADSTQQLDIEVVDAAAYRDQNGHEWILVAADDPDVYNSTTGEGRPDASRRVHDEKLGTPYGAADPTKYVTSQRCDAIAFIRENGQEVVILAPSNDDPNSSHSRAGTFIWSPEDYDPADDSQVIPPTLEESGDGHNYVSLVDGASGFFTGDAKIAMGPFWWIRKVRQSGGVLALIFNAEMSWSNNNVTDFNAFSIGLPGTDGFDMADKNTATISPTARNPLPHAGGGLGLNWFGYEPFVHEDTTENTFNVQVADSIRWDGVISGVNTHEFFVDLNPGTPEEAVSVMSAGYAIEFGHPPDNTKVPPDLGAAAEFVISSHTELATVTSVSRQINSVFIVPIPALQKIADEHGKATFRMAISGSGPYGSGFWTLTAASYKVTKDFPALDFPVDDENFPQFDPDGSLAQSSITVDRGGENFPQWLIDITVDVNTLEVTDVTTFA